MANQRELKCAIYTRKSCEDGLELEYNSLDAQYMGRGRTLDAGADGRIQEIAGT